MRIRRLIVIAVALLAMCAAVAAASPHPSLDLGLTSARAGAPARIMVGANLGAAVSGTMMSYEIDLARGFGFDGHAASALCTGRALRRDTCPALSRIGVGSGRIAVQGPYLPRTEYPITASLYLSPPRQRGDLAGVLLDLDENQSALQVALPGSVITRPRGRYGLGLRFSDTASELPARYHLTLADLDLDLGSSAYASGRHHNLFTNPRTCPRGGWPIAVAVRSGYVRRTFTTSTRCF
ncbi:MAG: hypothetical protein ACRDNK_05205 [Solirubrobacteraceae bacterium]